MGFFSDQAYVFSRYRLYNSALATVLQPWPLLIVCITPQYSVANQYYLSSDLNPFLPGGTQ